MINKNFAILMGVVALGIVTSAVVFRYDIQPARPGYFKTDRWTGTVWYCLMECERRG